MRSTSIIGLALLVMCACQPSSQNIQLPFPDLPDFSKEIAFLTEANPWVTKTVTNLAKTQTVREKGIDWKKELHFFISSDINHPKYKDGYEINRKDSAGFVVVDYKARQSNYLTKRVTAIIKDGKCVEAAYYVDDDNALYNSKLKLKYQPKKAYTIEVIDKVVPGQQNSLLVSGVFSIREKYRVTFDIGELNLPFIVEFNPSKESPSCAVINSTERIEAKTCEFSNDSFRITMPIFDSEMVFSATDYKGFWYNYSKGKYKIPMSMAISDNRFFISDNSSADFDGKWEVEFSPNTEDSYKAIGLFNQTGNHVAGTFITETGDYRFLEGTVHNDSMYLSCFDGSHVFLFRAAHDEQDSVIWGEFWSGKHWNEMWKGKRNENAHLAHPDSLTYLVDGYNSFDFEFLNLDSNLVSSNDLKYQDKVLLVQIMGSWCPNCMDETGWLSEVYNKYNSAGLEIVSIGFEVSREFGEARKSVKRLKESTGATYEFLIGGSARKQEAAAALPMLNHIMSYPTLVFIGRDKKVRRIHTGFYGPGTGIYFDKFKEDTEYFIDKLLNENKAS